MKTRSDEDESEDERSHLCQEDDVSSFVTKHYLLLGLRLSVRGKDREGVTIEGREKDIVGEETKP